MEALYSQPNLNLSIYQETNPVTYSYAQQGLWDAGNNYVANGRQFAAMPSTYRYNFTSMAAWNYLIDNAAVLVSAFEMALDLQVGGVLQSDACWPEPLLQQIVHQNNHGTVRHFAFMHVVLRQYSDPNRHII